MLLNAALFVSSIERSLTFYRDLLGFSIFEESTVEGDVVRFLSNGHYSAMRLVLLKLAPIALSTKLELLQFDECSRLTEAPDRPHPHAGSLAFCVPNLDEHIRRLRERGIEPCSDTFAIALPRLGRNSIVYYRDPDGHLIEFLE
jgi:catechol 2,3-dioxygenase-like lactoylglutathione lyase family enzyme